MWVGPKLEAEAGYLGLVVWTDRDFRVAAVGERLLGAHVDRGREEVDDAVEEHLHTLVLESRTRDDADKVEGQGGLTDAGAHLLDGHFLAVEVLRGEHVVEVSKTFDELGAPFSGFLLLAFGDFDRVELHALRVGLVVDVSDVLDQVDHALKVFALTDRDEERVGITLKLGADVVHCTEVIGTGTVHLIDESNAWYAVLVHLAPDRFGLGLNAGHRTEDSDGTIKNAQGALHLGREVHVTRGVDDVDTVIDVGEVTFLGRPASGNSGRGDRDATLAFLLHPVGGRSAIVHFAHLMDDARVEKNTLRGGRLAGVDVGSDADIARVLQGERAGRGVELGKFSHGRNQKSDGKGRVELPAEVGESTVGLSHLVRFFALLHDVARVVIGIDDFRGEGFGHRGTLTALGSKNDPAKGDAVLAFVADFDGNLVSGTTDAAALDLQLRTAVFEGAEQELDRVALHELLGNLLDRTVDDALGDRLLARLHHHIDELANQRATITSVRLVDALNCFTTTRHEEGVLKVRDGD